LLVKRRQPAGASEPLEDDTDDLDDMLEDDFDDDDDDYPGKDGVKKIDSSLKIEDDDYVDINDGD
jgi:hypothetical protein